MRIGLDVHVLNGVRQGTTTVWTHLLEALPPRHEYVLYSFDPSLTRRHWPDSHFEHRRISLGFPYARIQLEYPWLARRDRCDVFHVNYFGPLLGVPGLVVSMHDVLYLDFPEFAPPRRRWQFATLARLSAKRARHIITGSHYSRDRILRHFAVPEERVSVVYDGLSDAWRRPDDTRIARAWHGLRERTPQRYVVTVGRWDCRKNFVLTARVADVLRQEGLIDGLVIVGPDDVDVEAIQRQLRNEGLEKLVVRLSNLDELQLQAVYRNALALVFLSLAEGFGYPPLEAMSMGLPAVVSARTSLPEVCGDAALLVNPSDIEAVVAAARAAVAHEQVRRRAMTLGPIQAGRFDNTSMASQTVRIYERVHEERQRNAEARQLDYRVERTSDSRRR